MTPPPSAGPPPEPEGGDAACWLDQLCIDCGTIPDPPDGLDADGRCRACAERSPLTDEDYRKLAEFRASMRAFLRRSEEAARAAGVTPNQHQLLLAIRGWPDERPPGVSELAERLQLQVHSTGELLTRAEAAGLIRRTPDPDDGRRQRIELSEQGAATLAALTAVHRDQLRGLRQRMLQVLRDLDA